MDRNYDAYSLNPSLAEKQPFPLQYGIPILILTSIYFVVGQIFFPIWMLLLPPITIFIGIYSMKSEIILLSAFILSLTLIEFKTEHGTSSVSVFDALVGSIVLATIFGLLVKRVSLAQKFSAESNSYRIFLIFFVWAAFIGIYNILFSDTRFESWFREILLLSPLLVIPPIVSSINRNEKKMIRIFEATILLKWIITFIAALIKVRSSSLVATYLFEVGYAKFDTLSGPFMLFIFFCLYISEKKGKKNYFYLAGIFISVISTILTWNRTMWVLGIIGIPILVFFSFKEERKKAYSFFLKILSLGAVLFSALYLVIPFIRIILTFFFLHLLTSTQLTTDLSFRGRYIEWRYVFDAIKASPIVGFGFGSSYHVYNWFEGYHAIVGYTHNGYLGILLKSGMIGFILLFTAYFCFIIKGIILLRTKIITKKERAFIRSGITILVLLLVAMNTENIFNHRPMLVYIGIIWGYFLYIERTASEILHLSSGKTHTSGIKII
jgi:O-antigen ligase